MAYTPLVTYAVETNHCQPNHTCTRTEYMAVNACSIPPCATPMPVVVTPSYYVNGAMNHTTIIGYVKNNASG